MNTLNTINTQKRELALQYAPFNKLFKGDFKEVLRVAARSNKNHLSENLHFKKYVLYLLRLKSYRHYLKDCKKPPKKKHLEYLFNMQMTEEQINNNYYLAIS